MIGRAENLTPALLLLIPFHQILNISLKFTYGHLLDLKKNVTTRISNISSERYTRCTKIEH